MAGLNLFTNNAATTLASGILAGDSSLTVAAGTGALFPNPTAGQYFYCTLANNAGTVEIVKVTARSTDTFTITRGQDGTSAVAWNTGDKVELRLVNADLVNFPQLDSTNTFSQQQTFSNLTASKPVFTDGSKGLVSTGTVPTDQGGTGLTTFGAADNAIYSTSGSALTAGTLPIAAGGTGATTKTAAFDALAPTTTNGDMMYFNGTDVVRLGIGSSGQVLKVSGGVPVWGTDSGGFSNMQVYTSGSSSWTIPAGITACKITVVGGGGNGGGGNSPGTTTQATGSGGGGGGAAIRYYTGLTPGNTINYTVGAAGGTSSVSSGTQTITTISATGGSNGAFSPAGATPGGAGGTGSGGNINITGGGGGGSAGGSVSSYLAASLSGMGGSSIFGGGGQGRGSGSSAGSAGGNYGGGGSGATSFASNNAGGAGAGGVVIIEY